MGSWYLNVQSFLVCRFHQRVDCILKSRLAKGCGRGSFPNGRVRDELKRVAKLHVYVCARYIYLIVNITENCMSLLDTESQVDLRRIAATITLRDINSLAI